MHAHSPCFVCEWYLQGFWNIQIKLSMQMVLFKLLFIQWVWAVYRLKHILQDKYIRHINAYARCGLLVSGDGWSHYTV